MKTNFFQQIAGLGFNGNYLLNIHQDQTGVQTVGLDPVTQFFQGIGFRVIPVDPDELVGEHVAK